MVEETSNQFSQKMFFFLKREKTKVPPAGKHFLSSVKLPQCKIQYYKADIFCIKALCQSKWMLILALIN